VQGVVSEVKQIAEGVCFEAGNPTRSGPCRGTREEREKAAILLGKSMAENRGDEA